MKLNHYHLELKDIAGCIVMEADIPFTKPEELKRTCRAWSTVRNINQLTVSRGSRYQVYKPVLIDSNGHYRWEPVGRTKYGKRPFNY